jgi:hypothetical protein
MSGFGSKLATYTIFFWILSGGELKFNLAEDQPQHEFPET